MGLFAIGCSNNKDEVYTVEFNTDGGGTILSQQVPSGAKVEKPETPKRGTDIFNEWYDEQSGGGGLFDFDTPIEHDYVLTAHWQTQGTGPDPREKYTVTFDATGGNEVQAQEVASGDKAKRPTPPPTKDGSEFTGWCIQGHSETFNFEDTPITGHLTLVAGWMAAGTGSGATYTVQFNANGGTNASGQGSKTVNHGATVPAPSPAPTRDANYTFKGWYTQASGGSPYNFSSAVTSAFTLYAQWTPVQFTVTFNGNGGTLNGASSVKVDYNTKVSKPSDPSSSKIFRHWSEDQNSNAATGQSQEFDFNTPITGNKTLYAKWVAIVTGITIDSPHVVIAQGSQLDFKATATPADTMQTNIQWKLVKATGADDKPAYARMNGSTLVVDANAPAGTVIRVQASLYAGAEKKATKEVTILPRSRESAGLNHSAAIKSNNQLWLWGNNTAGKLGDNSTTQRNSPVQVSGGGEWASVSAGGTHTLAIKKDGTLWGWGASDRWQLGRSNSNPIATPVQIGDANHRWAFVSAGHDHSAAIKTNGDLVVWGGNSHFQVTAGAGTINTFTTKNLGVVHYVSAGYNHTAAIKRDGSLWLWGRNNFGQISRDTAGSGKVDQSGTAVEVTNGGQWKAVSAGGGQSGSSEVAFTVGIKTDGTLWAWGFNSSYLGTGRSSLSQTPTKVGSATNWTSVSAGSKHIVGVSGGAVHAWGQNDKGQIGNGGTGDGVNGPTKVKNALSASAGGTHSISFENNTTVMVWGDNAQGQIGKSGTHNSPTSHTGF